MITKKKKTINQVNKQDRQTERGGEGQHQQQQQEEEEGERMGGEKRNIVHFFHINYVIYTKKLLNYYFTIQ